MKELVHMNDQHMPTPIEQALEIDRDGCTTAKKLYRWLELDVLLREARVATAA